MLDIDECKNDTLSGCDKNADCYNVPGSHFCVCSTGYQPDGNTCTG